MSARPLPLQIASLISGSKVLGISLGVWSAVRHLANYELACHSGYLPTLESVVQSDTSLQITLPPGMEIPAQTECSVWEEKRWLRPCSSVVLPRKQWEMTLLMSS